MRIEQYRSDLTAALTTQVFARDLRCYDLVESTNTLALQELAAQTVAHGTVFLAARQSAGRGTHGRSWHSERAEGVWLSLVMLPPVRLAPLAFLPGLALVDWLRDVGVDAHLKWPNDVLVGSRKLAGFLVESQFRGNRAVGYVIGCGINVLQTSFPEELDRATSVRLETGREHPLPAVAAALLNNMERLVRAGSDLVALWPSRSKMVGVTARGERAGESFQVIVEGLSAEGHLCVRHADGRREAWSSHSGLAMEIDWQGSSV